MSIQMILSREGKPFTDHDAAMIKANIMSRELGESFTVMEHPEGGYFVTPRDGTLSVDESERQNTTNHPFAPQKSHQKSDEPSAAGQSHDFKEFAHSAASNNFFSSDSSESFDDLPDMTPFPDYDQNIRIDDISSDKPQSRTGWSAAEEMKPQKTVRQNKKQIKNNKTWFGIGARPHSDPHAKLISLRPAFRGFLNQQILIFFGVITYMFPYQLLAKLLDPESFAPGVGLAQYLPLLIMATGAVVVIVSFSKMFYEMIANKYSLEAKQIHQSYGIFARKTSTIMIGDVKTVDLQQTLIERILNVGTLKMATPGTSGYDAVFKGIVDPEHIQKEIYLRKDRIVREEA